MISRTIPGVSVLLLVQLNIETDAPLFNVEYDPNSLSKYSEYTFYS